MANVQCDHWDLVHQRHALTPQTRVDDVVIAVAKTQPGDIDEVTRMLLRGDVMLLWRSRAMAGEVVLMEAGVDDGDTVQLVARVLR